MFAQSTPAFPILAASAYLLSALWVVGTQIVILRRLVPGRDLLGAAGVVLGGELLALLPGGIAVSAMMAAVRAILSRAGAPAALQAVVLVDDILRPVGAGIMLLAWLAVWGALASGLKAVLLKVVWSMTPTPLEAGVANVCPRVLRNRRGHGGNHGRDAPRLRFVLNGVSPARRRLEPALCILRVTVMPEAPREATWGK
jgi:hypothetical protein